MMPVLLIILIPLGALVIYAVAHDLRRRRRGRIQPGKLLVQESEPETAHRNRPVDRG
jgi:hypothetical protein